MWSDLSAEPPERFSIDSQGVSPALSLSAGGKFFYAWAGQCCVQQVGRVGTGQALGPQYSVRLDVWQQGRGVQGNPEQEPEFQLWRLGENYLVICPH